MYITTNNRYIDSYAIRIRLDTFLMKCTHIFTVPFRSSNVIFIKCQCATLLDVVD